MFQLNNKTILFLKKSLFFKAIFILFFLIIIFSFLETLNNQKNVFADEEITGELDCGKEIPLGEAIEKTNDLLNDVVHELNSIRVNINYQITAAEEAISLANQCDISVCQPVNCGGYKTYYSCPPCLFTDPEEPLRCSTCSTDHCYFSQPCTSPWNGYACPQSSIESQFNSVQSSYNSIESSKNKIINLIDDNNEFLCDKLNEDIRGSTRCSQACLLNPGAAGCPKINVREAIRRKLYLARNEFDKCYVPPVDWAKILRGELSGKMLFPCSSVVQEEGGLSYYTKTTEKKDGKDIFLCTNNHNWFCCFNYGLESFLSSCSWVSGSNCPQGLLPADYRDCSNRSIRGMTCCCPDFESETIISPGPGPGPSPEPDNCKLISGSACPQGSLKYEFEYCGSNRSIRGMTCCCSGVKSDKQAWGTIYYLLIANSTPGSIPLRNMSDQVIGPTLSNNDWCAAALEGSVKINNDVFNYAGVKDPRQATCTHKPSERVRWKKTSHLYGTGNRNNALRPFRSIATDPKFIPSGSRVYIEKAVGISYSFGGQSYIHDGIFYADDVGGLITGNHIDFFIGEAKNQNDALNKNPFSFITSKSSGLFDIQILD